MTPRTRVPVAMKVDLLLNPANRSWIIQKMAERLAEELLPLGVDSQVLDVPRRDATVVHHMSWAFANMRTEAPSTMFITHLDDTHKLNEVRATLAQSVRVGICMSNDTMQQLLAHGCPHGSVSFINPAHDGLLKPRRIVIGITSRVYPDGRKREALLQDVAREMDLSAFEFRIFGLGWEPTVEILEQAGAVVRNFGETDDFRKDYETLQAEIPQFDHYLYLGMDEGSLGTLDALAAGVSTIVTPQGFHLDLPSGITHPVLEAEDLRKVLADLAEPRMARAGGVSSLSWAMYAQRHKALWEAMLSGQPLPIPNVSQAVGHEVVAAMQSLRDQSVRANAWNPRRMLSAVSRWPVLRGMRRAVDRVRLGR